MIRAGSLRRAPSVTGKALLCRRCYNSSCSCTKLIYSCKCPLTSVIHEDCLVEQIQTSSNLVSNSSQHPNYNEYKCPACDHAVFFRPDLSYEQIPCSNYTSDEYCIWATWIFIYLSFLGMIGYSIYELTRDESLKGLWIALIVIFSLLVIFFIWLHYWTLQAKFYFEVTVNPAGVPITQRNFMIK